MLREINECRTDPASYTLKVRSHLKYIKVNPDSKYGATHLYDKDPDGPKISLAEGPARFHECIGYLLNLKPMPPLKYCHDLSVRVPKHVVKWAKRESIADLLGEKKAMLANNYTDYTFHFDIGYDDPEISVIMQIVDDNIAFGGKRRESILDPYLTKVGISTQKLGIKTCSYLLFANST